MRIFLLILCAFGLSLCVVQPFQSPTRSGILVKSVGNPHFQAIARVSPALHGERPGLHAGQVIDISRMSRDDRYRLYNAGYPGTSLKIYVTGQRKSTALALASPEPMNWDVWLAYAGMAWSLCFAVFLLIRLPEERAALTLSALLIGVTLQSLLLPGNWITPWAWLDASAAAMASALLVSVALLATYATSLARPPSRLRILILWLAYAVPCGSACLGIAHVIAQFFDIFDPLSASHGAVFAINALPFVPPLAAGILTIAAARGAERSRFLWAFVPLALLFAGEFLDGLFSAFYPQIRLGRVADNVLAIIAPLGLTYSLLSRRVLDVGFILNRAAVFSGVSIVLGGAFVLIEWALGEWMNRESHAASLTIGAGVALALGLSMRFVHAKVEHVVDSVMFRKRREDEQALLRMAREASYITDSGTLVSRMLEAVERHADASFAQVVFETEWHDDNDPALVTLRATRDVLDLHNVSTELAGELAFPLVARGRVIGVLVLGPKRSQEAYAPDEVDAIRRLAHNAAAAFDALTLQSGGNEIAGALGALTAEIAALRRHLQPQEGV